MLLKVAEPEPDFVGFEPGPATVRVAVAHDYRAEHVRLDELKAQAAVGGPRGAALHVQGPIVEKILDMRSGPQRSPDRHGFARARRAL